MASPRGHVKYHRCSIRIELGHKGLIYCAKLKARLSMRTSLDVFLLTDKVFEDVIGAIE
jgi:hypothetical protein